MSASPSEMSAGLCFLDSSCSKGHNRMVQSKGRARSEAPAGSTLSREQLLGAAGGETRCEPLVWRCKPEVGCGSSRPRAQGHTVLWTMTQRRNSSLQQRHSATSGAPVRARAARMRRRLASRRGRGSWNFLRACAPLCWVGRGRALGWRCAAPGVVIGSLFTPHCGVATSPRELCGVWGGKRPGASAGLSASCGRRGEVAAGSPGSDGRALPSSGTRRPPWALCSRDT